MKKKVKDYWDEAADAWTDFVRTGKDIYREYLNTPGMLQLLGDISGRELLDLGCGEGFNTRILARMDAKVTGVDFSEKMIKLAKKAEEDDHLGIEYHVADAAHLHIFRNEKFDIITCFMVYMDFEDLDSVTREVARVLKKGGEAVISLPHPCFDMRIEEGDKVAGWIYERMDDPEDRGDPLYVKQMDYFQTGRYVLDWNMKRLNRPFKTISFRRTLTDYVHTLGRHGLYISDLLEPRPTEEGMVKYPELRKVLRVPQSIVFKAVKADIP